ncbi:BnaAnng32340D [Brassica napus]|uniref:BnaAnng32340D protein n=1 Tax=Brassica napus TaxID=3708 RepID=A0A078JU78_BRANA|nr:BnaAnng32340D [Brassica napus]
MDGYEATRIVLSRIQALDPDNASKIMGLLLLQDHGEKEMIRLAFGPENLVHSVIVKAKKELGLMSCSRPLWSQEEFVHSDGGGELVGSPSRMELLRSNSVPPRLAHQFMTRSSFSPKGVNLQNSDAQRAAAAALMMGDEFQKVGRWRPERIDLSAMACPASRQIYLTFPADSRFREEDVSNYFSTFGPVQDVRIPYQQKRMFGFVTFLYPETVKSILAKGNPHFVCDSRVLVKPYKEKGKVPDKYRTNQTTELELSPTGLDSSPRDVLGGRGFYNNAQDVMWRSKFEEEILELQSRRLMNMQLLDVKNHFQLNSSSTHIHSPNPFSQTLVSPRPGAVKAGGEIGKGSSKEGSDDDTINLQEKLEECLPDSPFASSTNHLFLFADSVDNNGSDLWSPSSDNDDNSTPSTLSDSFNSFNCQMPRSPAFGMLPGRGGPACRVGI